MKTVLPPIKAIEKWSKKVASDLDADVVFFSGEIAEPSDFQLIGKIKKYKKQRNIILLLTTPGGSADAAYRMMRFIHEKYEDGKISLFIPRYCKSAGTSLKKNAMYHPILTGKVKNMKTNNQRSTPPPHQRSPNLTFARLLQRATKNPFALNRTGNRKNSPAANRIAVLDASAD